MPEARKAERSTPWRPVSHWALLRGRAQLLAQALARAPRAQERPLSTSMFGNHGRRRSGTGDVFWQFRRYQQPDAATMIDWRASAKSDYLFIRQREEETAQTYWLWCDRSASMQFRSAGTDDSKLDRALVLTLATALFFLERGERVGLLGSGRKSFSTRAALDQFEDVLKTQADTDFTNLPIGHGSGRIVLIGDFHAQDDRLAHAVRLAQRRRLNGFILQVLDPAEIDFPYDGHVRFTDHESRLEEDVGRAEAMRARYIQEMDQWRDKLAAIARSGGWGYVRHNTARDPLPPLRALTDFVATR
jgi:uncharacterized protein (DUF58 family)